jgi:cell wall-associated NlpC family hydrolase
LKQDNPQTPTLDGYLCDKLKISDLMTVLKKFGLILFSALLGSTLTFAQNTTEQCEKDVKPAAKVDPVEFIHNQLLNAQAQRATLEKNPLLKSTTTSITIPKNQVSDDIQSRFVKRESKTTESTTETNSFGSGMMDWVKEKYSAMLDVLPNQITNVMLYRFIEDWYGTRYRMGGTTKSGVDCSAFVQNLYQYVFGLNLLRTAWMQFESSKYINNVSDLKEGDLVFFRINSSRITHVGVYLKNNFFVHSASSKGVSIANLTSSYWSKYFAGGGRVKE